MSRHLAAVCMAVLLVLSLTGSAIAGGAAKGGLTHETLIVPFVRGVQGVQTADTYSGRVQVKVTGTGQASGSEWSDAFYIFTDGDGNPVEPHHPEIWFMLWINGIPVDMFVAPIPPYNPDHVYVFQITVPDGPLTFAAGDAGVYDNNGEYRITVRDLPH